MSVVSFLILVDVLRGPIIGGCGLLSKVHEMGQRAPGIRPRFIANDSCIVGGSR
jgi:hypothetical protein